METKQQLQSIIDNAPKGATHIASGNYLQVEGSFCKVFNSLDVWSVPISNVEDVFIYRNPRLLSDIKTQIKLMEEIENLKDKLEQEELEHMATLSMLERME